MNRCDTPSARAAALRCSPPPPPPTPTATRTAPIRRSAPGRLPAHRVHAAGRSLAPGRRRAGRHAGLRHVRLHGDAAERRASARSTSASARTPSSRHPVVGRRTVRAHPAGRRAAALRCSPGATTACAGGRDGSSEARTSPRPGRFSGCPRALRNDRRRWLVLPDRRRTVAAAPRDEAACRARARRTGAPHRAQHRAHPARRRRAAGRRAADRAGLNPASGQHEVVAVDRLVGRPRQQLAHGAGLHAP